MYKNNVWRVIRQYKSTMFYNVFVMARGKKKSP